MLAPDDLAAVALHVRLSIEFIFARKCTLALVSEEDDFGLKSPAPAAWGFASLFAVYLCKCL